MDLLHALDEHHGVQRADRVVQRSENDGVLGATRTVTSKGTPVTADAVRWEGWGTALRPAFEPLALMWWLVMLIVPVGGVVLEPFAGSGTTVEAATGAGFRVIAIEKNADYLPLIRARLKI